MRTPDLLDPRGDADVYQAIEHLRDLIQVELQFGRFARPSRAMDGCGSEPRFVARRPEDG